MPSYASTTESFTLELVPRHPHIITSTMSKNTGRVAAVQAEPVWNDLEGGVQKVISIIEQAAANGANVLGFPEVFIPGYPWYVELKL